MIKLATEESRRLPGRAHSPSSSARGHGCVPRPCGHGLREGLLQFDSEFLHPLELSDLVQKGKINFLLKVDTT